MAGMSYYVYILQCSDNSFYVGVTNDLYRRFNEHSNGVDEFCYTYSRRPLDLVHYSEFSTPEHAIAFEKQLKGWSRKKKFALIENNWERLKALSECQNETHYKISIVRKKSI